MPALASYGNAARSRSRTTSVYYAGQGENPLNLSLMRLIDEQFLETPYHGSRQMTRTLRRQGDVVARKRVLPPDATAGGARALPATQDVSAAPGALDLSLPECAICGSRGRTTCGARMLPTFACSGAICI